MNDLLIIFLVLLVLLTLISTMGGSIYSKEKFEEEEEEEVSEPFWQEEDPVEHPKDVDTAVPEFSPIETFEEEEEAETQQEPSQSVEGEIVEGFDGDMYAAY